MGAASCRAKLAGIYQFDIFLPAWYPYYLFQEGPKQYTCLHGRPLSMEPHLQRLPEFVKVIRSIQETIITNIVLIGQTPSPTFREKRRTEVFLDRLTDYQVDECTTDGYGNPIGIYNSI